MALTALEAFTGMILRPMQGPLTHAQEIKLMTLKHTPWEGKALAATYEADLRAGRVPRI
jgi:hypothetical protein